MGKGKGRKRREANYRAAHGGLHSLPAPPTPADAMAIPSKLRHIMSLKASNASSSSASPSPHLPRSSQRSNGQLKLKLKPGKNKENFETFKKLRQSDEQNQLQNLQQEKHEDNSAREEGDGDIQIEKLSVPKLKKRKRNESMQDLMDKYRITPVRKGLSERKKKYLQDKKKKKKPSKNYTTDSSSLHQEDRIGFGEVVEAPPKLSIPKKETSISQERLRLQAVEAYRQKKKWTSRPGSHKPPLLKPVNTH